MTDRKAFPLRIAPSLYDAVQQWADDELRSVNGQIEYLLRDALKQAGRLRAKGDGDTSAPDVADPTDS